MMLPGWGDREGYSSSADLLGAIPQRPLPVVLLAHRQSQGRVFMCLLKAPQPCLETSAPLYRAPTLPT
jgi:hypothetical protein